MACCKLWMEFTPKGSRGLFPSIVSPIPSLTPLPFLYPPLWESWTHCWVRFPKEEGQNVPPVPREAEAGTPSHAMSPGRICAAFAAHVTNNPLQQTAHPQLEGQPSVPGQYWENNKQAVATSASCPGEAVPSREGREALKLNEQWTGDGSIFSPSHCPKYSVTTSLKRCFSEHPGKSTEVVSMSCFCITSFTVFLPLNFFHFLFENPLCLSSLVFIPIHPSAVLTFWCSSKIHHWFPYNPNTKWTIC